MTVTNNIALTLLEQSQAQKEITINEALSRIDALLNIGAIDKDLNTPPTTPMAGDAYIISASPTGAWSGKAKQFTYFDQIWRFIQPKEGMSVWVKDEDKQYIFDGANWLGNNFSSPVIIGEIEIPAGSNAAPSLNFTGDKDTGIAKSGGADSFSFISGGQEQVRINYTASTTNYIALTGANASAPKIYADGSSTNIDLKISPKGSGVVDFGYAASNASSPAAFSANRYLAVKCNGTTYYLPLATVAW